MIRTHCRQGHDLTIPDALRRGSDGFGRCRVCERGRQRALKAAEKETTKKNKQLTTRDIRRLRDVAEARHLEVFTPRILDMIEMMERESCRWMKDEMAVKIKQLRTVQ